MYSIKFPDMLSSAKTNLVKDKDATMSNLKLLLNSWKQSLFGDPYFGTNIKRFIYEQNNIILRDIIIDDIYVSITEFMPQIYITRKDINIFLDKSVVKCEINCINKLNNTNDLYSINLMDTD